MRPKDEHKETAIRKLALDMIVEEGFKGLSMQKLAKKANVSPATIYIYFEDRNDLLNKLYLQVLERTNVAALAGFDAGMGFEQGLQTLWLNRYRYYIKNPVDYFFIEQFINSPLIHDVAGQEDKAFGKTMQQFYTNAVNNDGLKTLPFEIYWTMTNAPLYQFIKFRLQKTVHPAKQMTITEDKLLAMLQLVIAALKV